MKHHFFEMAKRQIINSKNENYKSQSQIDKMEFVVVGPISLSSFLTSPETTDPSNIVFVPSKHRSRSYLPSRGQVWFAILLHPLLSSSLSIHQCHYFNVRFISFSHLHFLRGINILACTLRYWILLFVRAFSICP